MIDPAKVGQAGAKGGGDDGWSSAASNGSAATEAITVVTEFGGVAA